ncbi:uncharacterized protein LOC116710661 [Xiphophorus hellerii]|uniref:uncharacterized protein LOC116710661 n=1 Tax=Xiphophorus hellerii TaxID=8084 RepID=UPI0013B3B859|nr:uncharacterized protein LOC116710661 [Xiphophorus hellerii]
MLPLFCFWHKAFSRDASLPSLFLCVSFSISPVTGNEYISVSLQLCCRLLCYELNSVICDVNAQCRGFTSSSRSPPARGSGTLRKEPDFLSKVNVILFFLNNWGLRPVLKFWQADRPVSARRLDAILAGEFVKYQTTQERPGSPPVPGIDWVRLKVIKRKWSEPRFTGPYRVVERTSHAVRLQGKGDTWFHWSQCTAAEEPQRALRDVQEDLQLQSSDEEHRQALPGGSVAGIPATTTSSS